MFYAGFCDLGHFYSAKPPPWSLDLGFHTLDGDFVVLFVNAHLETLKKWKTNLPKGLFCRRRITSFGSNGGRRPRLPHPLLELLKPPPKAVYLCICVSVYLCICVSVYLCIRSSAAFSLSPLSSVLGGCSVSDLGASATETVSGVLSEPASVYGACSLRSTTLPNTGTGS